jgi:hypothetical protein
VLDEQQGGNPDSYDVYARDERTMRNLDHALRPGDPTQYSSTVPCPC